MKVPLTDLDAGETATVVELRGGHGMRHRLVRLGIREGTVLNIVRPPGLGGPAVVTAGGVQIALGFGMAGRVFVEIDRG